MKRVDLNVDIGEGFPHDEELLKFATSANVSGGEHAGSWELTQETVIRCKSLGKRCGMHPGYPDRPGMGRRSFFSLNENAWGSSLLQQTQRFREAFDPDYVKPHGAFYNDTAFPLEHVKPPVSGSVYQDSSFVPDSIETYRAHFLKGLPGGSFLVAILQTTHCLMGLPGTLHETAAWLAGASFIREGFADRAYDRLGLLVPRSEPGAILEAPEQIRRQVLELAPRVDSICLHGDTPNCLEFAELVYKTLVDAGYEVGY